VAKLLGGSMEAVIPIAAAIEMIHTYSLIHDDLPAMDNDDYRRGKPTNHKVYGEATAILAGDGLLNEAFELMIINALNAGDKMKRALEAALIVSRAAGKNGMIAGQVIDMESEGKDISHITLKRMHKKKTGALLLASVMAPAVLLDASPCERKSLSEYAEGIGISFQIKDDILDVESSAQVLGKPVGSDSRNNKNTYVSLFGLDHAKKMLSDSTKKAVEALEYFRENAWFLREMAFYIGERNH